MESKYLFNSVSNADRWASRVKQVCPQAKVSRLDSVCTLVGDHNVQRTASAFLLHFSGYLMEGEELESWNNICDSFTYHCPIHHEEVKKYLPPSKSGHPHCPKCNRKMAWVPNGGTEVPVQTVDNMVGWGATKEEVKAFLSGTAT